jgi:hypothetical protein
MFFGLFSARRYGRPPAWRIPRPSLFLASLLPVLAGAGSAAAQCALHDAPALFSAGPAARLGLSIRSTALSAAPGSLSEAEISASFAAGPRWDASMRWSFAVLDLPAGRAAGLGDPAWEIGYRARAGDWTLGASGQVSAPLGDAGNGLGADAFGTAGYLSAAFARARWSAGALAGFHAMFATANGMEGMHMHGGADAPLSQAYALAHPHADRELVYRLEGARDLGPWGLGLALDGSHVVGTAMGVPGTDFLEGEASLRISLGSSLWTPSARIPLSARRRLDFSIGLTATRDW